MFRKRVKYFIDPITLSLKKVEKSGRKLTRKLLSGLGISIVLGLGFAFLFFKYVDSPQENSISREINHYKLLMQILNKKSDKAIEILNIIQTKDDKTYRSIFSMPPLDDDVRNAGIGGPNSLDNEFEFVENGEILFDTKNKLDLIARKILIQKKSFAELSNVIANKEKMLSSIPSIMPLDIKRVRMSSGFGWRRNPFTGASSQFHPGIDLAGKVGVPIYASGDGVVIDPNKPMSGYGKVIVINHGFGFQTLYAHLSKIYVKYGEEVKRGQIIGLLGNTGPSTGPHLHYEVIKNGERVNPINYIYSGFSDEEYQQIIKDAEENSKILS